MRVNIKLNDPTPVIVQAMTPASGSANYRAMSVARVAMNATSQADAGFSWINPEASTIAAQVHITFTTGGTGTMDLGISDDGTGSSDGLINGGTLTQGVHYVQEILGTVAASAIKGGEDKLWFLLGPGGTGTNNSIVGKHTDTVTSTAIGAMTVAYYIVGT